MAVDAARLPQLEVTYTDDPRVVHEAALEDYTRHVLPRTWRSGRLSLIGAWWALASAMFWLIFAALVALTVGTEDALIGIGLAVLLYGAINWVLSEYASRTGTTVNLFSRTLFGYVGSIVAPLLFAATAIYYATFEGSVIAVALHEYFGGMSLKLWYLVVVLYSLPLVIGGVRAFLDKFNGFLYPFYIAGLIMAVVWTIVVHGDKGGHWLSQEPDKLAVSGPGWWWAFTAYMGVMIMMMFTWDFARFGKVEDKRFHGAVSFGPVFYTMALLVNGVVGIFLALTIPTPGGAPLSELSGVLGMVAMMGFWAVALIWVSQTRINTANFYLASTNSENFAARVLKLKLPRWIWVLVVGAIVYAFMLVDIFTILLTATQYQGVLIAAWTAVALTYIAWARLRRIPAEKAEWRPGRVPMFNWGGLAGVGAGSAVGLILLNVGSAGDWTKTWVSPLTFVTSVVVYAASLEFARRSWFVMDRPYDPRAEVDDPWEARIRCHHCEKAYIAQEMDRDPEHGHKPICQSCAQASPTFYRHARQEAKRYAGESGGTGVGDVLPGTVAS